MQGVHLQSFDKLISQKRRGLLSRAIGVISPSKLRYLEQDFLDIWDQSLKKKLDNAISGSRLEFGYRLLDSGQARERRDIYQGTTKPGVMLEFTVDHSDRCALMKQILTRSKNNRKAQDPFAFWRSYVWPDIQAGKFDSEIRLILISRVKPGQGQNYQNQKTPKIIQYSQKGFSGNIYFWFDLSKYKSDILSRQNERKQSQDDSFQDENTEAGQEGLFKMFNDPEYDKVKIGSFEVDLSKNEEKKGFFGKLNSIFVTGTIGNDLIKKIKQIGTKDSSVKPDLLKTNTGLGVSATPYVNCISSITLEDWIENAGDNIQAKSLDKMVDSKKSVKTMITSYNFDQKLLRSNIDGFNPVQDAQKADLNEWKCLKGGRMIDAGSWSSTGKIEDSFFKGLVQRNNGGGGMTLRFQSWIRDAQSQYYFDYRVYINIGQFLQTARELGRLNDQRQRLQSLYSDQADSGDPSSPAKRGIAPSGSRNGWTKRQIAANKGKIKALQQQIETLNKVSKDFKSWICAVFDNESEHANNTNNHVFYPTKALYNSDGVRQGVDIVLKEQLHNLRSRDHTAWQFLQSFIKERFWQLSIGSQTLDSKMVACKQQVQNQPSMGYGSYF